MADLDQLKKWLKVSVSCAECKAQLMRRLYRPVDGKRILDFFCDTKCKGTWQRKQKPWTRDWLYQKYVVEGLDAPQIARIVGRNSKGVWCWLRDYGIATRPRGCNHIYLPKDGSSFKGRHHTAEVREAIRQQRLADGRVPYLKNGVHWLKGCRSEDHPKWKGGATPERQAFYSTEEWKSAVIAVWYRADAKCERCRVHHNTATRRGTFHIHHIVSFAVRELRAELSNLMLLCQDCHRFVHSRRNVNHLFIEEDSRWQSTDKKLPSVTQSIMAMQ